jgi:hypothetical protein
LFTLKFDTKNAAFDDGGTEAETVRILREIAEKIEAGIDDGAVYDVNGNRVGDFRLTGLR